MRCTGWWVLAGWLLPGLAWGQVEVTMTFDDVMVVPIQPADPSMAAEAARLDEMLRTLVGGGHVVTAIDEVPRFEEQDYDARTYMTACPPGQYAGCMLVVAQRVEMDWAIGGTLEPAGLGGGESQLTVHIVDVVGSREVMAFGVVVGGRTDDAKVVAGVSGVFDNVVGGLTDEIDLRGDLDDPAAQEAFEARRQKLIAASLAQLEGQLGEVIREEIAVGMLQAPKLTRKDLAEYDQRDDRPPWERLSMTRAQYLRFENSGASLLEWRRRLRGRLGQILIRADAGGGPGPWGLHHEGRWLVGFNPVNSQFENFAIQQYQEARRTGSSQLQAELGFGVLPWLEIAGVYGFKNAAYSFRFKQDVDGEPAIPGKEIRTPGGTSELGVRVQAVPLPTYQVRPTVHAGFVAWSGGSILPEQEPLVTLEGPSATFLQAGLGVEASAGRFLNLFVRGHKDILLSGTWFDERAEGEVDRLENVPPPEGDYRAGWAIQLGFQVRIGLLKDPDDRLKAGGWTEEEEEPDL